jgi:hypothetical protein
MQKSEQLDKEAVDLKLLFAHDQSQLMQKIHIVMDYKFCLVDIKEVVQGCTMLTPNDQESL